MRRRACVSQLAMQRCIIPAGGLTANRVTFTSFRPLAMQGGLRMPKPGRRPLMLFCLTTLSSTVDGRMGHCPTFVVLGSEIPLHQQPQSVQHLQVTRHWKHPDAPMLHSSPLYGHKLRSLCTPMHQLCCSFDFNILACPAFHCTTIIMGMYLIRM